MVFHLIWGGGGAWFGVPFGVLRLCSLLLSSYVFVVCCCGVLLVLRVSCLVLVLCAFRALWCVLLGVLSYGPFSGWSLVV